MPSKSADREDKAGREARQDNREDKLDLIQRSLGLRHKLKVHESMKPPETHEDLSIMMLAKWELEDELHAIEELLADLRLENVEVKKAAILKEGVKVKKIGRRR